MKRLWLALLLCPAIMGSSSLAQADTVILTNGKVLNNATVDTQGETSKISYNGSTFSIAKNRIKSIEPDAAPIKPQRSASAEAAKQIIPIQSTPPKSDDGENISNQAFLKLCQGVVTKDSKVRNEYHENSHLDKLGTIDDLLNYNTNESSLLEIKEDKRFWLYWETRDNVKAKRLKEMVAGINIESLRRHSDDRDAKFFRAIGYGSDLQENSFAIDEQTKRERMEAIKKAQEEYQRQQLLALKSSLGNSSRFEYPRDINFSSAYTNNYNNPYTYNDTYTRDDARRDIGFMKRDMLNSRLNELENIAGTPQRLSLTERNSLDNRMHDIITERNNIRY